MTKPNFHQQALDISEILFSNKENGLANLEIWLRSNHNQTLADISDALLVHGEFADTELLVSGRREAGKLVESWIEIPNSVERP